MGQREKSGSYIYMHDLPKTGIIKYTFKYYSNLQLSEIFENMVLGDYSFSAEIL